MSGKKGQPERAKLARILGAGPVADLLKRMEPLQVRPRSAEVWEDVPEEKESRVDSVLLRVIRAEMKEQGLTGVELPRQAGILNQTLALTLSGASSPNWNNLRKIVAGLGKSLTWLAKAIG